MPITVPDFIWRPEVFAPGMHLLKIVETAHHDISDSVKTIFFFFYLFDDLDTSLKILCYPWFDMHKYLT